ncbi:MAG: hypothetical protein S4CHLAM20_05390 [Chlamydiia bacterium]|nr:hypothetical protein [Chlamydiia bacterium]
MNLKNMTKSLIAMVCATSALFGSEEMAVRLNGCKGPVLCSSFPLATPEEDCCQLWHVDAGLLYQQPGFADMNAGEAYQTQFAVTDAAGAFVDQTIYKLYQCFDYELGLTVSLGHLSKHDYWYFGARFDWMSTSTGTKTFDDVNREYKAVPGFDTDVLPLTIFSLTDVWTKVNYNANVDFYSLDVMLSRGAYLSRCYSFEPFAGVKVVWFDNKQVVNYFNSTIFTAGNYGIYDVKQQNWGAGVMFGFNGEYHITEGISLFSDSDVAVLYGESKETAKSIITKGGATGTGSTITTDRVITAKNDLDCQYFVPVRSILGVKLATYCLDDQHYLAVKLGYDARSIISYTNTSRGYVMSGLYANFIWDF